jgi:hypothetical protein
MREFYADEWYEVAGRGNIAVCYIPLDQKLPEKDEMVRIDDKLYKVSGCETTKGHTRGKMVGIIARLVDPVVSALMEISLKRAKIKEEWIKTWLAVNIPDEDLTPELFNSLELVEKHVGDEIKYWVQEKK